MAEPPYTPKRHRRVVTGLDENGRSMVLFDSDSPHGFLIEKAGWLHLTEMWETPTAPAHNFGIRDAADHERRIEPVGGGTVFRIIEYPPDRVRLQTLEPERYFASMGAQVADAATRKHPGMHKTNTVDYCIVLSGEIYAVLDKVEVLLRAGDCLIQRGTNHAWSNRSEEPCVIAFVLVGAHSVP
jgi:mannose-6-phosphate isomerase-like protein (cupin superfamily)